MDIRSALNHAQQQLTGSTSPRLDAEVLLAHSLSKNRSYLFTWPEHILSAAQLRTFERLLNRRQQGIPIAYILGYREFWGLTLKVSPATLIPRPETELLVELALSKLDTTQAFRVLDLGTGSGAIAIAIAKERPNATVIACDYSIEALSIAQHNAQQLGLTQLQCLHSDWFAAIPPQSFDLIISNPPYIAEQDQHLTHGDIVFEPALALCSGNDGLSAIRQIIQQAPAYLKQGSCLLLEHGYDQGAVVGDLLHQAGFINVECQPDLAGHDRVSVGQCLVNAQPI